jgi:DNA invertase Pin-like site-specific DNA recombinase
MRVSTGRQAEHDLSIPDQRRQLESWCRNLGYAVVQEFIESGASSPGPAERRGKIASSAIAPQKSCSLARLGRWL